MAHDSATNPTTKTRKLLTKSQPIIPYFYQFEKGFNEKQNLGRKIQLFTWADQVKFKCIRQFGSFLYRLNGVVDFRY